MSEQDGYDLLLKEIRELKEKVDKVENDLEDIKYFTPAAQPSRFNKEMVSTIGGIVLGALVIIGIFF